MGYLALIGLAWIAAAPAAMGDNPRAHPYADHLLVEVEVPDAAELQRLLATGVDPWPDHPRPGRLAVLVAPERRAALWADDWSLRVLSSDVQGDVDAEWARLAAAVRPVPGGGAFFTDFRDLAAIDAEIDALAAAAPELVTILDIGESLEGRAIRAVRITAEGPDDRPAVIVTAGQHAREWIAISSGMYVVDQLVTRASEPQLAAMLDDVQLFVIPVVNPDGYAYTWTDQRYWRKNRRDGIGVDTNRNFGHGWGGEGAGTQAFEENYAGPSAFSEPETIAVRDFVQGHPELVAYLDVHSFGQLVLYPWGDVQAEAPDDAALSATATAIAAAMGEQGAQYTPLQGAALYPAAGNAIDWSYADAGLHAITMELRPQDMEIGFVLPPDQIVPVGDEVLAGLWVMMQWAQAQAMEPPGESSTGAASSDGSGADTTTAASDSSGAVGTESSTGPVMPGGGSGLGDSTGVDAAPDGASGCGCDATRTPAAPWALVLLLVLGRIRRSGSREGGRRWGAGG